MKYIEYTIRVSSPDMADLLASDLADVGFESFAEWENGVLKGYVTESEQEVNTVAINALLSDHPHKACAIEQQNWNALWESNFEPIELGTMCRIRAPFHEPATDAFAHELIIMPKMSFGTGHHPTTYLMVESILGAALNGKQGLDMGSGTGILAILAAKCGARHIDAIDIDEWAWENCRENAELNGVADRVTPYLGDASLLAEKDATYDFVLANINRNILLRDMAHYARTMRSGATIVFSGFLEFDIPAIVGGIEKCGLTVQHQRLHEGWASVTALKN